MSHATHATPGCGRAALRAVLLLALASATPLAAQTDYYNTDAGRPIITEDAYPVEFRALELQVAPLRLERARGGAYRWGVEPEVAVGFLPRTQLELGAPLAVVEGAGRSRAGLAGLELSLLHTLNVETRLPAVAVAAEVLLPVGAFAPERAYPSVKGILTKTLPWARFHLNGAWTIADAPTADASGIGELSRWTGGLAVDRTFPLRSLLVTGEVTARRPIVVAEEVEWSSAAGFRYQLSPRLATDAGAGVRLTGDERGWFATVGAALAVGLPWSSR